MPPGHGDRKQWASEYESPGSVFKNSLLGWANLGSEVQVHNGFSSMRHFVTVCRVTDIPAGEARMFIVNENRIGIFNIGGEFFALDDHCPHAGASLAHGNMDGDVISCRIHDWRFSIRNGKYLDEDKPACNAKIFTVRVVGEQIQVAT